MEPGHEIALRSLSDQQLQLLARDLGEVMWLRGPRVELALDSGTKVREYLRGHREEFKAAMVDEYRRLLDGEHNFNYWNSKPALS